MPGGGPGQDGALPFPVLDSAAFQPGGAPWTPAALAGGQIRGGPTVAEIQSPCTPQGGLGEGPDPLDRGVELPARLRWCFAVLCSYRAYL